MGQSATKTIAISIGLLIIGAGLIGYQLWKKQVHKTQFIQTVQQIKPTAIELLPSDILLIKSKSHQAVLPFDGQIFAKKKALVKSSIPQGEIEQVLFSEGETVRKNQLLLIIHDKDAQLRQEQATNAVKAAQTRLALAQLQLDKNKILLDKGFISQLAFANLKTQYQLAKNELLSSQITLKQINQSIGDLKIYAPMSGTIKTQYVQVGERVPPDMRLLEMVDLRVLELEANLPSGDIDQLGVGQTIQFQSEGSKHVYSSHIKRINPSLTPNRTIKVYADIINSGRLKDGQYVQGTVIVKDFKQIITIPESALYRDKNQTFVWLIVNDRLKRHSINPIPQSGVADGWIMVNPQELPIGSEIIAHQLEQLTEGLAIKRLPPPVTQ